jgi:hypothetical protein
MLEPALQIGQLGTCVLFPRMRLREVPAERSQLGLGEVGQLDGRSRERRLRRVGRFRLRRRLLHLATLLQLGAEARAESVLGVVLGGGH